MPRGRIGPVQVFQDKHGRGGARQVGDERAPRCERRAMNFLGGEPPQRRTRRQAHHARERRDQIGVAGDAGQGTLHRGPHHRVGQVRGHAGDGGEQLPVEAVRRGRRVRGAPALEPAHLPVAGSGRVAGLAAGGQAAAALLDQARLAQARLRGDHDDRPAAAQRVPQRRAEHRQLILPAHEPPAPAETGRARGRARPRAAEVAVRHRAGHRAGDHLLAAVPGEQVPRGGPGHRAHQDRTRTRRRLERGGGAHHLADGRVLHLSATADRAEHRMAGLDPDAQR